MTQHSQNGEGVDPNSIYEIGRNSPRFSWPERAAVDEADVEAGLGAYVPGGSSVYCWLPMKDGHTIHQTARDVMRAAIAAVDKRRQSLTAREPATADVGREALESIAAKAQQMADAKQDQAGLWQACADEARAALSRAAPSSGHAMADKGVAPPFECSEINCAVCGESVKYTSAGYCFSCIKGFKVPLATTPPTTNDAIPAGMVAMLEAADEAVAHVLEMPDEQVIAEATPDDIAWAAGFKTGLRAALATPKPSPTPKGGLPGRGEVEAEPVAWLHTLHMEGGQTIERILQWDGIDEDKPERNGFGVAGRDYSEEYTVTVDPLFRVIAAPAEAIRDGGEGGETA